MMSNAKQFLKVCVLMFVLCALVAASASATTVGWMVNGTMLSGSQALATTAAVDSPFVTTLAGVITITCTGGTLNGVAPQISSPSSGSASSAIFTGCGTGSSPCVLAGQNAGGTIGSLPVTSEVTLEGTSAVVGTIKPAGSQFGTIALTGSKCSLTGVTSSKGEIVVEGPTNQGESTLQLSSAVTTAASGDLKIGAAAASLTGAALFKLANSDTFSYL
jgi:hypothetical protein